MGLVGKYNVCPYMGKVSEHMLLTLRSNSLMIEVVNNRLALDIDTILLMKLPLLKQ